MDKHGMTQREMEYLAPKVIQTMNRRSRTNAFIRSWGVVIFFLLMLTLLNREVGHLVDNQATQAQLIKQAEAAEVSPLCKQYLHDTKLVGTAAEQTLKQICL